MTVALWSMLFYDLYRYCAIYTIIYISIKKMSEHMNACIYKHYTHRHIYSHVLDSWYFQKYTLLTHNFM